MILFCFLWPPLFYLFWRSLNGLKNREREAWALALGCIAALVQFLFGPFIDPGGFGLSRWVSALVDIVALPVVLPFGLCFLCALFKLISFEANFTNNVFLYLIPTALARALDWSFGDDPLLLAGVPVLWTALAAGMGFFVRILQNGWGLVTIPAALGTAILPLAASGSYWAFFSRHTAAAYILLGITLVPCVLSLIMGFLELLKRPVHND